ncbi:hypothetical protein ACP70R_009819 [Stipagrostis hirtigluma subsp. patula]
MAQPPPATAPTDPCVNLPRYMAEMSPYFSFKPNGRGLVERYLVPRALHGRVPENIIQDAVADGVDVYAARPEALPFQSCNRSQRGDCEVVWGYFSTRRPAAAGSGAGGGDDGEDVRGVSGGGCWCRYGGREKEYVGDDGGVIAFRRRLAFYEAAEDGGGKLTQWCAKEFYLNEAAAAFRGGTFHPSAKDLVIWKVYKEWFPEEEPAVDYYSNDDDDMDGAQRKTKITVRDLVAGPAATVA